MENWDELYGLQRQLDEGILETHSLTRESVLDDKILALLVEIGELANETRCFKYWSHKGPSESSVILEEFVDGIHFLLSLGLDYGYRFNGETDENSGLNQTDQFHQVYDRINRFKQNPTNIHYQQLFKSYMKLGQLLNFKEKDIFKAYLDKNKVNHERQQTGY
ncbi:dUTP diphosphatase [Aquisalibacillus elongatus]|uniref:Dimeric dUTPase (All-alpha-NTP-PPase superfamily) n=1 Tax=Aquisalibacillus elongatus TaxID=485577 RepID=A0A3N5BD56_9BACI|nr:dUTP diphosphatase [Aquisalibacillus elongatus]RPF55413.1 dimeric dUTPase (all-alpha-NTP-PPase superfamily) [Aquisalibacillus elongatus]